MANPLAWLPFHGDKKSRRAALLGGALVFSLAFHAGLPFIRWHNVEAVSETPIQFALMPPPPIPLPEADELVPTPNEDTVEAPVVPELPVAKPAEDKPIEKPAEVVEEPPPAEKLAPPEEPVEPPPVLPVTDAATDAQKRLAELEKQRAERMAERDRRRAEREARRQAAREKASGGKKGGAPDSGEWKLGTPEAVYMCSATDKGTELHVTKSRPLIDWVTIIPTVLVGFETKPDLGAYLNKITQVIGRDRTQSPRRIGFVEIALPNDAFQIFLEDPSGVKIVAGRNDAKCLVGFKYAQGLFPFSLLRVPVRFVDGENNIVAAIVDVTFYKDVTIEITASDGTELPFKQARLKNAKSIKQNIQDHYEAAKLAKGIADLFGIQLGKRPTKNTKPSSPGK